MTKIIRIDYCCNTDHYCIDKFIMQVKLQSLKDDNSAKK